MSDIVQKPWGFFHTLRHDGVERVSRAMDALAKRHKFTTEQLQWLSLVREQLIKNLTIDEDDFDNTPLLQGRGGVARAKQVFGELNLLVGQLNEMIAT
ncbi:MAG: type I restriction-modification enzyme R subunit C-terminal domain-containing protein [Limisphaerales bacterium]